MSDSSFALFAEFLEWKKAQERLKNESVLTAGVVGNVGPLPESGLQLGSQDAKNNPPATVNNPSGSLSVDADAHDSAGCTNKESSPRNPSDCEIEPGASAATCPTETDFTADEYLSRSKKFNAAKKFRVSDFSPVIRTLK